jgi:phosphoribosylaminoimidazole (AIR) synthetase
MGMGMILVVPAPAVDRACQAAAAEGFDAVPIGHVRQGAGIRFS